MDLRSHRGSITLTSAPSCVSSPPRAGPSSAGGRADASPPEVPAVSPPSSSPLRRKRGLRWTSYFSDWSPSVCMLFWLSLTCSLVSSKDILSSISFVLFRSSSSFIFCSIILSTSSSSKIWKKRDTNYNNIIVGKKSGFLVMVGKKCSCQPKPALWYLTLSFAVSFSHNVFVEGSGHGVGQLRSVLQSRHGDRKWRGQLHAAESIEKIWLVNTVTGSNSKRWQ